MKNYILFIFLLVFVACSTKEQRQESLIEKGYQSLDKGQTKQAFNYFESAIDINSENASAWNGLGVTHYQDGYPYEAVQAFGKALQYKPDYTRAYYNRSNAFYQTGEYYRALDDLEPVLKAYQDSAFAHLAKGLALVGLENYKEAEKSFLIGLELDASNSEIQTNLAAVAYYQKEYETAIKYLDEALELNPKEANAWNLLALVQSERKNFEKALKSVNEAIAIQAGQPYFLNNRGYIYTFLGQYDQAYADLRKSIVTDEKNPFVYRNLGILALKKEDYTEAVRQLENALSKRNDLPSTHFYLGEALRLNNQMKEACVAYQKSAQFKDLEGMEAYKKYCND
ncbi:tetratricopeptide repeat protein [Marivirga sp.]|uniref:tetratricopeptide repeat protein n=1 Tax=Marivirga sp. TaxID=2018662 RepID=UPI002D80DE22|nr:tetratricopeptide repeat protein [Marivirga sp.]HET8859650.1 tetratricopeptide repeat protein [Marivirga sp.]